MEVTQHHFVSWNLSMELINEAKQILDVEDVIASIFLVEDLRVIKN